MRTRRRSALRNWVSKQASSFPEHPAPLEFKRSGKCRGAMDPPALQGRLCNAVNQHIVAKNQGCQSKRHIQKQAMPCGALRRGRPSDRAGPGCADRRARVRQRMLPQCVRDALAHRRDVPRRHAPLGLVLRGAPWPQEGLNSAEAGSDRRVGAVDIVAGALAPAR